MSKFIGRQLGIGIGKEASRGVGVAPSYWLHATAFSHNDKVTKAREEGYNGGIWMGDQAFVAQKWAEGDIEVELTDKSFPLILLSAFGALSSAVVETTAYKHSITLTNSSQHQTLSLHTTNPIGDLIFELAMLDKLSIKITPNEIVKYTASFKSKSSQTSESTSTYVAENKFLGRHLSLKVAANTGALAAASKVAVKTLTLNIEKNTEIYNAIGTVQPNDIVNKNFSITGELELSYDDETYKNYMLDGTYKAMRIDLVNSDATVGATSNPSFRIDLSKVDFDAWEANYPLNDLVTQKISFTALYDLGGNGNVINDCYVINGVASY
jgi:hypothetical protein